MKQKRVWCGVSAFLVSAFILTQSLSVYAIKSEADINQMLGTSSYEIKNSDGGDTEYFKSKTSSLDEHMDNKLNMIERLVDEGTVLVKNNGALPFKGVAKITLLGRSSVDVVYNGSSGNGTIGNSGNENINLTLKVGLEKAGFTVNPVMWDYYKANSKTESDPSVLPNEGISDYSDAAIVVLTRNAGEGADAADGYYELTETEKALVEKAKQISSKVVVLVNSPSPLAFDEFDRDDGVDAILQVGGLGATGVKSIGNILSGKVNPSGRLVDTYAADSRSSAAYQNISTYAYTNAAEITAASPNGSGEGNTKYVVQQEGIYIGYKYYETRYEDAVLNQGNASGNAGVYESKGNWNYADEVTYSFGYGLSYTTFEKTITSFKVENNVVKMDVKVKNTGDVAGKEVVQVYAQTPYTEYDKKNGVEKSSIQLLNFGKTQELKPGEEETVTVKMDIYNIASYDSAIEQNYILDEGSYYFAVGNGAHDALNNILAAKGKSLADGMDYDGDSSLAKKWQKTEFEVLDDYEFTEEGFTTVNGLYHNNTGTEVCNRLDEGDLNNLLGDGATVYLTRSDWQGTWPTAQTTLTPNDYMVDRLTFNGVYEKGSSDTSEFTYNSGTTYQISIMMGLPYDHEMWDVILDQLMIEEMIVTVGKNFGAIDPILGISFPGTSDNDGVGSGPCTRYLKEFDDGSTPFEGVTAYSSIDAKMFPSETVEAATFNQELIYEFGEILSEESYYNGMTTLWGPGLNLHRTPYSGRNFEYFSECSQLTYILGAQITAGMQSNGMIACPKHFVVNDQEQDRYGYSVYLNEQTARENSLRGFEGCVAVGKAKNIMTALNRYGCDWIGACEPIQNDILRDEWGFDGYTITDNAVYPYMCGNCIALGTDKFMLLPGNDRNDQLNKQAVLSDARLFEALRTATHRILYVYVNSKAMNGMAANAEIVPVTPWWKAALITVDVVLGVLAIGSLAWYVVGETKNKKKEA